MGIITIRITNTRSRNIEHRPRRRDCPYDWSEVRRATRLSHPQHKPPHKKDTHRALEDILESIEELRFYKTKLFKKVQP